MVRVVSGLVGALLISGCYGGLSERPAGEPEIVRNLLEAGFPRSEIKVVADHEAIVGGDAIVSLEASREMSRGSHTGQQQFRHYSTDNLIADGITEICILHEFEGDMATALEGAVTAYNDLALRFTVRAIEVNDPTCPATISADLWGDDNSQSGLAGFPSGGLPFGQIFIGEDIPSDFGVDVARHVIMHEIGHCLGLRHTDYYDRSISCGGDSFDEGEAGVGANRIPGTPDDAEYDGSVMNACYNDGSSGQWTFFDVMAFARLFSPPMDTCMDRCGAASLDDSCYCDSSCEEFNDCCADFGNICVPPQPLPGERRLSSCIGSDCE